MTNIVNYSGIDISKNKFDVSIEQAGSILSKSFSYTSDGMESFLSYLPSGCHCIVESTGTYHSRLASFLYLSGIAVSVVNPLSVKRFSQALMLRTKTDKADSRLLVKYGRHFSPALWTPPAEYQVCLRQLLKLREQLDKEHTAISNQLEAVHHSFYQDSFVLGMQKRRLTALESDRDAVDKQMEFLLREYESANLDLLSSIPGIGKRTAIVLLTLTDGMRNFSNYRELCSYVGLAPRIYESGSSVRGRSGICKMGMGMVRKLLYMCALSARRHNQSCKLLYERLLAKGKAKKLALIAVANKLLKQAFAIIKKKCEYNANFLNKKLAL